jgi:hypothetical protein
MIQNNKRHPNWLMFFYSVPSKPVSNRMKIWRKLIKAGAIQFKGAVYLLPYSEDHYDFFQWLVSEVTDMEGEAALVNVENIDTMKDIEIIGLFNQQRGVEYRSLEKRLDGLERKISSIRKGGGIKDTQNFMEEFDKSYKEYREIKKIDFFSSEAGNALKKKLELLGEDIKNISSTVTKKQHYTITPKRIEDYQNKTWVTRKRPFVDRMASAWLIKKFIDKKAIFRFIDEQGMEDLGKETVTFDTRGGQFTHIGDMCTFETLVRVFGIRDKAIKKIGEIVHDLDVKDDKYKNPETKGIEDILIGIRKTSKDDAEALEKGIALFEMLYASNTA